MELAEPQYALTSNARQCIVENHECMDAIGWVVGLAPMTRVSLFRTLVARS